MEADLDAVRLCNPAETIQLCGDLFGFSLIGESCARADDHLCTKLCEVRDDGLDLLQTAVHGRNGEAGFGKKLLHFIDRDLCKISGELCTDIAELCDGLQLFGRSHLLLNEGINLNIDVFHERYHLSVIKKMCGDENAAAHGGS